MNFLPSQQKQSSLLWGFLSNCWLHFRFSGWIVLIVFFPLGGLFFLVRRISSFSLQVVKYINQLTLNDGRLGPVSDMLRSFHDIIVMGILVIIFIVVLIISLGRRLNSFFSTSFKIHSNIEILWIFFPVFILLSLGGPSIFLLYELEDFCETPKFSLGITGYQWYWVYELPNENFLFDEDQRKRSGESEENVSAPLFLSRDIFKKVSNDDREHASEILLRNFIDGLNNLSCSTNVKCRGRQAYRLFLTAGDVIHRWALPRLFLKMDAIPGRLNQTAIFFPSQQVIFFGQCRELCGTNHRFIPIAVELI